MRLVEVMLDGLREAAFTYGEVGRTRGELPAGYRHLRRRAVNGRVRDRFEEAAGVLLAWGVQRRPGRGSRPPAKPWPKVSSRWSPWGSGRG
ncbi:DUF1990 family protein [Amycolatopsis thermoflava]|uniref:DUF1990 family protein n=1 Tax=Amycolatopsis thermoflava TaxID=84480 RepID=UPI003F4A4B89